ncbi:MAG: ABC transporter permease, partial [Firmicutes bacterium]|nr:ABC transporter permease [Bacillota bacterium]
MKNFRSVLRFELSGYFKSKIYLAMTLLFVFVLMVALSFPNIKAMFSKQETAAPQTTVVWGEQTSQAPGKDALAVLNQPGALSGDGLNRFISAMGGRSLYIVSDDAQKLRDQVQSGLYEGAVIMRDPQTVTYIARNLALGDNTASVIRSAFVSAARYEALSALEIPEAEADQILNPAVSVNVDNLGVSQNETFFYTYILLLALYMAIMLYGQIVAMSIATEKGSRTMELLITSTRPNSLLFGKIIAAALSGLIQMGVIFGSAVLFYHLNASA